MKTEDEVRDPKRGTFLLFGFRLGSVPPAFDLFAEGIDPWVAHCTQCGERAWFSRAAIQSWLDQEGRDPDAVLAALCLDCARRLARDPETPGDLRDLLFHRGVTLDGD